MGWTPTHYGPSAEDEANEFQRQLEASGLFKVTLKSTEWEQYQTIYKQGAYDMWILGWFPDYPDADDYLSPFLVDGGFFANGYHNAQANKLVAQEQGTDDQAKREKIFGQLQDIAAKDVPFIPSLGRPEHRGVRRGHEGCGGHTRPVVHLPVLVGHQERLSDSQHTVVGRDPSGLSPRPVPGGH